MAEVTNISAYLFATLDNLKPLRDRLIEVCRQWNLKGTILLSTEGINMFVAGSAADIDQLLAVLRAVPGLERLEPKVSLSKEQPFSRMLVKIKKEIIAFGVEGIDPAGNPAPRLSARELKKWLDEGRPLTLLDTRNDYEVSLGTFRNAVAIGVDHFRDFPAAAAKLDPEIRQHPIVTFCTGGIRCEKAAPYMIQQGFQQVFQLDGGILKYFEECGQDHYQGECFVFDKRVGLAADLGESGRGLCYACQSMLTPEMMNDPRTVEGVSCPNCYRTPEQQLSLTQAQHQQRIREITNPLPGRQPRDNFRPLKIDALHDGATLQAFLVDVFQHLSAEYWLDRFASGDIVDAEYRTVGPTHPVRAGEFYRTRQKQQVEPDVNAQIDILHEDEALIVLNKPAPLPMHPGGRFNRNTLTSIIADAYAPLKPRPAHRLDANTSGVVVLTKTAKYARMVQPQFERGEVQKRYLARVIGHPTEDFFRCEAKISAVEGPCGARIVDEIQGSPALTEFQVLSRDPDNTTLLCVTPHTGRTNQIRVHLWHLGWPIVGDSIYKPHHQLGETQTLAIEDSPLNLHAWRLTFKHPQQSNTITFEAPRPCWAKEKEGLSSS